jgi:hypothetical protein
MNLSVHWILSPARLPVPPQQQTSDYFFSESQVAESHFAESQDNVSGSEEVEVVELQAANVTNVKINKTFFMC